MMGYGIGPDMFSVDYQQLISANNALMSQLYPGGQYPYLPNYPMPPTGFMRPDYHMNGGINPSSMKPDQMPVPFPPYDHTGAPYNMDHSMNRMMVDPSVFPWNQAAVLNSLELRPTGSSNVNTGNDSGNHPLSSFPTSSSDWQLQSMMSTGESMENIAQFLSQYHSQSFENVQAAHLNNSGKKIEGKEDQKESEKSPEAVSSSKKSSDEIGYPIDDHTGYNSGISTVKNGGGNPPQTDHGVVRIKPEINGVKTKVENLQEMSGYSIPSNTMASMASMYLRNAVPDASGRLGPPYMNPPISNKVVFPFSLNKLVVTVAMLGYS